MITPEALLACGARLARYRGRFIVIALPIYGEKLKDAPPVGYVLYNITGGKLPTYHRKEDGSGWDVEWKKMKVVAGSQPGVIGRF